MDAGWEMQEENERRRYEEEQALLADPNSGYHEWLDKVNGG